MARDEAYRIAEQKIEAARRSGAKELSLEPSLSQQIYSSTQGSARRLHNLEKLTELPESLGQLTQLQSLNLSDNQLTALPESLGRLTQLQSLNLSRNQLTALPEWLGQLTQLQSLNLPSNQLTALPEWLGRLTQLQSLGLSGNQLRALPESLGRLTQLQMLHLSGNQLRALPESLGQLTQLQSLNLSGNQLTALPESLGQLTQLQSLDLDGNRLTALPEWLGQFAELETLRVAENQLTNLPDSLGQLTRLAYATVSRNQLTTLPDTLCRLTRLETLYAYRNRLSSLPGSLGKLKALEILDISGNRVTELPESAALLTNIETLNLGDESDGPNPLNPELAAAYKEGLDAVKRYLREMAKGAKKRYEAKLLILGDGNEGKTCVSRALRDLPFRKQNPTRGVDVEQWAFPHPDDAKNREKEITLNIWDFEGQEISHQSHQFFLTSQSLYLLVFKCRDQFQMDRAEYWLDTIRARAPQAKVAIVISQCEEQSPLVPLDRIQAQYGEMLTKEWFFTVGCEDGKNIAKLKAFLQRWAADLEFMGSNWPVSYSKAETEIKAKAKKRTAQITRKKLDVIFAKAGVSKDGFEDAAAAMSRLGFITQFPDCPDLRDFIVLRPQWLTKAISEVMEDGKLTDDKGELTLPRMEGMWRKNYPGMFATFHNCMKEFELCYDLEDDVRICLVPLRFGYVKPEIPWSNIPDQKARRIEYKLNIRPPLGIMSRFIVKTHHMIVKTPEHPKGVYWHNGVFLRTGLGPLASEALCEFMPEERKLCIEVRAAYPQNLCEEIHAYVKAVFSFFEGMTAERSYGCIKVDAQTGAEAPCTGVHTEKRIYTAISKQRPLMDCEFEEHEIDPRTLVWGFSSFSEFLLTKVDVRNIVRQENDRQPNWAVPFLRGVDSLLDWVNVNGTKLDRILPKQSELSAEFKQEAEAKLHEYLALMSQMLDNREATAAPGLISIGTKDRSKFNPAIYFKMTYVLTPFCECKGNIHRCEDAKLEFTKDRDWWEKTAPWVVRGTKVLSAGLSLAFAGMPLVMGDEVFGEIKDEVELMGELAKHLELDDNVKKALSAGDEVLRGEAEKAGASDASKAKLYRAAMTRLLKAIAPNNYEAQRWGSLRRIHMSDNSYRWLCDACAKKAH